jgi:hypothetical protein
VATAAADNNGGDPGDTLGPDIDSTLLGTRADQVDGTTLTITFAGSTVHGAVWPEVR